MWITSSKKSKGFTLIELLVVIAIIGILSTVAMVSLTSAKRRARDARRVSDIQQMRNALLIYSNERATYPVVGVTDTSLILGEGNALCLDNSNAGFKASGCAGLIIMQRVPGEQVPGYGQKYEYRKNGPSDYDITFKLEGTVGDLPGGICVANPDGITCG